MMLPNTMLNLCKTKYTVFRFNDSMLMYDLQTNRILIQNPNFDVQACALHLEQNVINPVYGVAKKSRRTSIPYAGPSWKEIGMEIAHHTTNDFQIAEEWVQRLTQVNPVGWNIVTHYNM